MHRKFLLQNAETKENAQKPVDKNKTDWYSKLVEQLRQTKSCTTNLPFDVEGRLHYNKKKTLGGLKYGSSTCRTNLRCAYANDHGR